jgi:segregation and condensation protein B
MTGQDVSVEHDDVVDPTAEEPTVEQPSDHNGAPLLLPLDVDDAGLARGIEAILFVVDEPVSAGVLSETLGVALERVQTALTTLSDQYRDEQRGIELLEVAGGWRLMTRPAAREVLERWIIGARHGRLTQAALETLAVIAYRQPIARQTVGEIRGVNPDGALRSLVARGLVREVGRDDAPGQAVLFGTTTLFLERMGLSDLRELPPLPSYLPDGPAPDEPDATGLAELRRRLREGSQRLGGERAAVSAQERLDVAGALAADEPDDDGDLMPAPSAPRGRDDGEIIALSDRLEQAARSAMGRLRHAQAVTASREADEQDENDEQDPAGQVDEVAHAADAASAAEVDDRG